MKNKISISLYFLVLIILVIFIIYFANNNSAPVSINILSMTLLSQLWIVVMSSLLIGIFIGLAFSLYYIIRLNVKLSKLSKVVKQEMDQTADLFKDTETEQKQN